MYTIIMWLRLAVGLTVYEIALIGLFQVDAVPDSLWKLLEQYPPLLIVALVAYYMYRMQREENETNREWLEKMLKAQRESLSEAYNGKNIFEATLLEQMNAKQNNMAERIELLTQQIAVNTATVSEIAKVDSIVQDLIARLENK